MSAFCFQVYLMANISEFDSKVPVLVLDLGKSPYERWSAVLDCLNNFSLDQFQRDFQQFIEPLYKQCSSNLKRIILEVTKRPDLLFDEYFAEEVVGLSFLLGVKLHLLIFQNIIYEIFVSGYPWSAKAGCTGVICEVSGAVCLARTIDFEYDSYWRRYSFLAKLLDASGKGKH